MQEDIVVEGVTIKGLSQSESDRNTYMPNAELVMDSTERFISINIDSNYLVSGAVIETNTCLRQMVYTTKDFAYIQDIEALNKKIEYLAEQSHFNDIQTFSMQEDFATVDEVNTVLTNYVQIKDLHPVVELSEYYKKSEVDEMYDVLTDYFNQHEEIIEGLIEARDDHGIAIAKLKIQAFYTGYELPTQEEKESINELINYRYVKSERKLYVGNDSGMICLFAFKDITNRKH